MDGLLFAEEFARAGIREHVRYKPFYCLDCGKEFPASGALKVHERTHTGERPYACQKCTKTYSSSSHLNYHLHIHSGEKPFHCPLCEKAFRRSIDLRRHERRHTKPFSCEECGKAYGSNFELRKHIREKPSGCQMQRDKTFCEKKRLKIHERTHTGECRVCGKAFRDKAGLVKHMRTHNEKEAFHCTLCLKKFNLSFYLKRHMMRAHSRNEKASGSESFHLVGQTRRTRRRHGAGGEKPQQKHTAGKPSPLLHWRKALTSHLEGYEKMLSQCLPSGKSLSTGRRGRKRTCVWCGKVSRNLSDLEIHQRTHAGEKPSYECDVCDKRFVFSGFFLRHVRRHAGEVRGRCLPCHKSFTSFEDLDKHVQMHWS